MSYNREESIRAYKSYLLELVKQAEKNDSFFDEVAEVLQLESDAKSLLHQKGYGYTGLNILETVKLVPCAGEKK